MYSVTLFNESGIFDSDDEIETAQEAVEFAAGRGGNYGIHIVKNENYAGMLHVLWTYGRTFQIENDPGVSLEWDEDEPYHPWSMISKEKLIKMVEKM